MKEVKDKIHSVTKELSKVIVGQEKVVNQILVAILCDTNALLESYPGLGKTTMIKTMAEIMDLKFSRIQSTPDLMPTDITGTYVLEEEKGKRFFSFHKGPIFANIVLVDEINRATPKTQSALLEAMQEKQVTLGRNTFELERPFFVLATQNPIDQEGTYPLPEAQTDRFLLKIKVDYPTLEEEDLIIDRFTGQTPIQSVKKIFSADVLKKFQSYTKQVPIANDLKRKVLKLVNLTRSEKAMIEYGASPRASMGLVMASKANALLDGRNFVSKKDIEEMALPVLRHRIIMNFEAERRGMTTDDVIMELLKKI
ncbi:MoxR family ATPase [archaeon]|jgi:MoxR-like ATPase|nr:MoxR family ATPase [archaeon]MBT3720393.1 MoxR family ATPase [archaeon]MBT4022138.1 MoxR family ATPase [archaeon]MBT4272751.1 MoxR family ATPase [archaeon]MBT4461550.1 MoxR family ATPase [archaeon]